MKKFLYAFTGFILLLIIVYFLGPKPKTPQFDTALPAIPEQPSALGDYVRQKEHRHKIKPGNEAEIVWADSAHSLTPYAFAYLHGFSASKIEGDPVHRQLAKAFGANLYLARLAEQGIDTVDAMKNFTPENQWASAREAYAIGKKLGKKVVVIGCSTGGTLALKLAATYPDIAGLILISPNIAINNPSAFLLNDPWGKQIAEKVFGGDNRVVDGKSPDYQKYWYTRYHVNAVVQLEELVESTMTAETFRAVKQPVLTVFYYKDQEHQDDVVRVDKMHGMMKALSTPGNMKIEKSVPNGGNHVLGSSVTSKDWKSVLVAAEDFCREKLKMSSKSE
ncbi:MAG: alpha/beta hydrolase [Mucilaginibacter polytrichastri]|nr:alpha/beta hydrolase [Mucilaginibacter polytrichastri]